MKDKTPGTRVGSAGKIMVIILAGAFALFSLGCTKCGVGTVKDKTGSLSWTCYDAKVVRCIDSAVEREDPTGGGREDPTGGERSFICDAPSSCAEGTREDPTGGERGADDNYECVVEEPEEATPDEEE